MGWCWIPYRTHSATCFKEIQLCPQADTHSALDKNRLKPVLPPQHLLLILYKVLEGVACLLHSPLNVSLLCHLAIWYSNMDSPRGSAVLKILEGFPHVPPADCMLLVTLPGTDICFCHAGLHEEHLLNYAFTKGLICSVFWGKTTEASSLFLTLFMKEKGDVGTMSLRARLGLCSFITVGIKYFQNECKSLH